MSDSPFAQTLAGALVLSTERFELRPLSSEDLIGFFAELSDPEVVRLTNIEPFTEMEQASAILDRISTARADGRGVRWAIHDRASGEHVGTCGFNSLVWNYGYRGEIGYDVVREWWGRRVMDEALPAMLAFGFGALGLRRIEALVMPENQRSWALLERHGFEREGLMRDHGFWKDDFHDTYLYAKLG